MARGVVSPIRALAKLTEERLALDAREAELRKQATREIGEPMVGANAHSIDLKKLENIVGLVVGLGAAETIKRLEATG